MYREVLRNGFSLHHDELLPPGRVDYVDQVLRKLDIWSLRLNMLRYFLIYGNCVILPHFNAFGQLLWLELLVMDRIMPIFDTTTESVLGWDYWVGYHSTVYEKDEVLHLGAWSLKHPDIGLPFLAPLAIDIEADLGASDLNAQVMFKAGMIGTIIVTDDPGDGVAGRTGDRFAARLEHKIQTGFSGTKGANSILVSNFIKGVHKLSQLGDFDASFMKLRDMVTKEVATIFQIPPARLNVMLKSAGVYDSKGVHDTGTAAMDRAVSGYMQIIDTFINERILKELLGIYDVEIRANGSMGMLTLESAQAIKQLTDAGPILDVNEARILAGLPVRPPGDKRGKQVLDNSAARTATNGPIPPEYTDDSNTPRGIKDPGSVDEEDEDTNEDREGHSG